MNNKILYGNKILKQILKKIKQKILNKINKYNKKPFIIILNIKKNIPSQLYIKNACTYFKYVNINYKICNLDKKISEINLIKYINNINNNKNIDCILIQLPLPKHLNTNKIVNNINPEKDVDCLNAINIGKLSQGKPFIKPCTSSGIIKILKYYKINLSGLNCLIIGSSNIVGKPIIMELINMGCTVTIANKKTKNIKKHIKNSKLLISAIGKYNVIKTKWINKKSIIIDIGINKLKNKKITGDINFKSTIKKIKYITPVPGGIGLTTIAMLIKNIYFLFKHQIKKNTNQ